MSLFPIRVVSAVVSTTKTSLWKMHPEYQQKHFHNEFQQVSRQDLQEGPLSVAVMLWILTFRCMKKNHKPSSQSFFSLEADLGYVKRP